jgi:nitroreductase
MKIVDLPPLCAGAEDQTQSIVDAVIRSRTAVRAFSPAPVSKSTLKEIFEVARHAPSNSNSQPWYAHVLEGEPKRLFSEAVMRSHEKDELPPSGHFPNELPAVCKDRQADFGNRLYKVLGIDREDARGRYRQTGRNYCFFDAPVGLIFSIDRRLTKHSWLDFGLFLQTVMLAARSRGLDTCPQVSFVRHEPVIQDFLKLPADQTIVCGMSMGYAEPGAALNRLGMPRAEVDAFATFLGFEKEAS